MNILGIENRTENWKTVQHFYGLSGNARACLARHIVAKHLGSDSAKLGVDFEDVAIGLFWYGMRDYVHQCDRDRKELEADFANIYVQKFPKLRDDLGILRQRLPYRFLEMKPYHYALPESTYQSKLYNNLTSTEVDVVLETSDYLLIGECKHESDLGVNPDYILVHQVIRQYVMARILANYISLSAEVDVKEKEVIPFIVGDGDKLGSIRNSTQIRFMTEVGWLREGNILDWNQVSDICRSS